MKRGRMVEKRHPEHLYDLRGTYREIDASAHSLNIEKLARVLVDDGDDGRHGKW
jgi:hypothetical protein